MEISPGPAVAMNVEDVDSPAPETKAERQESPPAKANPWVALLRSKFPPASAAPSAQAETPSASDAPKGVGAGFEGLMEKLNVKIDSVLKAQEKFSNFEGTIKTMKNEIGDLKAKID